VKLVRTARTHPELGVLGVSKRMTPKESEKADFETATTGGPKSKREAGLI
jgi:hypothetical protein